MAEAAVTSGGPAPAAPSTPSAGGSASAGAGTSGAGAGAASPAPASNTSFAGAMSAAQAAGGSPAAGQQGSSGVAALSQQPPAGQPAGQGQSQPQAPQTPATFESALAAHPQLLQQIAQMQSWAMYAQQEYQRNQLAKQQQGAAQPPGQPQQQPKKHPFGLPDFDPALKQFLAVDDQGNVVPKPGAPPYAAAQYAAYQQAKVQAAESFFDDPEKYLGDMIDRRAAQIAERMASGQLQGAQTKAQAEQFVTSNRQWIYDLDAQGQVQRSWDGSPRFTPLGSLLAQKIEEAKHFIPDPMKQVQYAMAFVQSANSQQAGQQSAAQQQAQANAARGNFLQQAQAAAAQGGAAAPPQPPAAAPRAPGAPMETASQRMRRAAEASGLNLYAPAVA